jgi:hypothetical protein
LFRRHRVEATVGNHHKEKAKRGEPHNGERNPLTRRDAWPRNGK